MKRPPRLARPAPPPPSPGRQPRPRDIEERIARYAELVRKRLPLFPRKP